VCVPAWVVTFKQPLNNSTLNLATANPFTFGVSVTLLDGGTAPASLTSVPLTIPNWRSVVGPLTRMAGNDFTVALPLPAVEENFVATAGWTTVRATSSFRVDRVAPTLTVVLPPTPARGSWRRDELIPAVVRPSEPLTLAGVIVTLSAGSAPTSVPTQTVDLSGASCTSRGLALVANDVCVLLDLASPVMNALSDTFAVTATANDLAGNPSSARTQFTVTRVRWFNTTFGNGQFTAAPALDSAGNIYVGSEARTNDGSGSLYSFSPEGQARTGFPRAVGDVRSLSVATSRIANNGTAEVVYAAVNLGGFSGSELRAFTTSGSTTGLSTVTCRDLQRPTHSALALFEGGMNETRAALVFSGTIAGTLCEYGPAGGASTPLAPARSEYVQAAVSPAGAPFSATNLVIRQNRVWFQSNSTNSIVWAALSGSGPNVGGRTGSVALATPTGLSLAGDVLLSTWDRLSGGVLGVVDLPTPGAYEFAPSNSPQVSWGSRAFAPAIMLRGSSSTQAFALTPNGRPLSLASNNLFTTPISLTTRVLSGNSTALGAPLPGNEVVTTPVIGTGAKVYSVTSGGTLNVYQAQGSTGLTGATPLWSTTAAALGTSFSVVAPPTLDCNRVAVNRPGTLYVLGQTGAGAGVLAAIIVDSTKLDPTAPWPKWQRTAGNAGNPAFPLNPGCP
jgi:hypothetical protein